MDPSRFEGTVSKAANWLEVGRSRGYSRSNGQSTDTLGPAKTRLVDPLRPDARARLRASAVPPEWWRRPRLVPDEAADLPSLLEWLEEVPDPRSGPALRDRLSAVLALLVRAKVAGQPGGRPPEVFAKALPQNELELWGCPCNRRTQRYEALSDTTFQRVLAHVEPSALERVAPLWIAPRCRRPQALAGDGQRIRGANRRSSEDAPWETVALVDHRSGLPVASRRYREAGGELAARRGLFEEVDLQGTTVTLDAGHTSRETLLARQEQPGADTRATSQGHAGWADDLLAQDGHGAGPEARRIAERGTPGHGRWERRALVTTAAGRDAWLPWPGVWQGLRVKPRTQQKQQGKVTTAGLYGFTSLSPEQASPRRLLQLHRGHWTVENRNPLPRDVSLGEDASHIRTGHGPANHAARNNLVLAWLLRSGRGATVPLTQSHFSVRRDEALEALQAKQ